MIALLIGIVIGIFISKLFRKARDTIRSLKHIDDFNPWGTE